MSKYILYILLAFVLAVLPSLHIISALEIYDEKRVFQVVLLLAVGLLFVGTRLIASLQDGESDNNARPYVMNSVATWGIAFFMLLGIASIWLNGDWYHGLQELSLYILLFAFMLFTAHIYVYTSDSITGSDGIAYNRPFEKGMGLLLLLFGGLYALKFFIGYGMYWFIDYPLWPGQSYQYKLFGFANIRFLNQVQVWTLPLLVMWGTNGLPSDGWAGRPTDKKEDVPIHPSDRKSSVLMGYLFLFLAAFWWCLIIQSGGRGATLSLIISSLIVFIIFKGNAKKWIKNYFYAFVVGSLCYFLLFFISLPDDIPTNTLIRDTSSWRLFVWQNTLENIVVDPFLGHGPFQFANIQDITNWAHPHNSILQLAYEFGIPAMLLAVALVLWGLYSWFNQMSGPSMERPHVSEQQFLEDKPSGRSMLRPNTIRIGVSTSLLAGLGYSLFSGVMVMPLSQLWMALVGGWALGIYISDTTNNNKGDLPSFQNLASLMFKGVVIAAIVFMSYSLIHDVPELNKNQQQYQEEYGGKYHPRFWQQGKIGRETL